MKRALALIDGEHHPAVVRDALAELPYEFVAAYLVGGEEKLRGLEGYGVPLAADLEGGLEEFRAEIVVDLSDEPVLGPRERLVLASRVLARGRAYVGADFTFEPPALEPFELPSLAVVGTGKRVGKTAVTGHAARLLAADREVVVVSMGRGGPPDPELAESRPSVERLLELSRAGRHAASDYLETAAFAGVVTVGCRRCGGGLAGMPFTSNVPAGARLAALRRPDLVLFDGSGTALPPVDTSKRVLVAGGGQEPEVVGGYLNAYRILVSDLVVLTMAEPGGRYEQVRHAIERVDPSVTVVAVVLRPRPIEPVAGRRVAFFAAAPEAALGPLTDHLRRAHGAEVVHASGNLARRADLRRELAGLNADVYLVELKAAAIELVAEVARERGVELVLADNEVLPLPGEPDLDAELLALAESAVADRAAA